MRITCSKCGASYEVDASMVGQVCKCTVCNSNIIMGTTALPQSGAAQANYSAPAVREKNPVMSIVLFIVGWMFSAIPGRIMRIFYSPIYDALGSKMAAFVIDGTDILFTLLAAGLFLWAFLLTRKSAAMSIWRILSVVYLFTCAEIIIQNICNIISSFFE